MLAIAARQWWVRSCATLSGMAALALGWRLAQFGGRAPAPGVV